MTKFAFLLLCLLGLFFAAACSEQNVPSEPTPLRRPPIAEDVGLSIPDEIITLSLQIEITGHRLALHEPHVGIFTGAYIKRDTTTSGIKAFEDALGAEHAIFAYTMTLDGEYPLRWVLENISLQKTPFIMVLPPEDGFVYDTRLVAELAANVGRFDVPMFVNLFPLLAGHDFVPAEYIEFFRHARGIFAKYAPNAALVWGFDAQKTALAMEFYPGRDAADWIHLIIYNDVDANGRFQDFFAHIDLFYLVFQHEGPLVISTAVSHYSLANNTYFTREAAEKITYIYSRLPEYPRIRAIIYRNYSDLQGSGHKYTINTAADISTAYAAALSAPHFLASVISTAHAEEATLRIHSPFRAIMRNSYFYIPARALIYDARFPYLQVLEGKGIKIGTEVFYAMADINRVSGADFFVDMERRTLVLR